MTVIFKNQGSMEEEVYAAFYFAINLIADLAAILLECKINGSVNLNELAGFDLEAKVSDIRITAASIVW